MGDSIGGSHISALSLIRGLDESRCRARILLHETGPLSEHLDSLGLAYEIFGLPRYVGRGRNLPQHAGALITTAPRLRTFLRRAAIDILHSNDARMHLTWALPCRLARTRMIWHQRNVYAPSRLTDALIRFPDWVVANSHFVSRQLPASARPRSTVIENPFEAPPALKRESCRHRLLEELGLPADCRLVGSFGNLITWKRPLDFVRTACLLAREHEGPLAFPVFGEDRDSLRLRMETIADEGGLGGRLFFMGFRQPVWPWIAACDLVLAPAVDEPFGRVLVEAMLVGSAVVASDSGGHREIVETETNGLLVPALDPEAMAAAALTLLRDPDRRTALTRRARDMAAKRFSAQRHAEQVVALYETPAVADKAAA